MSEKFLDFGGSTSDEVFSSGANHLLVIGINAYLTDGIRNLNNARPDAERLVELLTTHYRFERDKATALYDEGANLKDIVLAMRKLVSSIPEGDNLLIYFSGHGHFDKQLKEGYWVPTDAKYDQYETYLPYSTLKTMVKAASHLQHILLIADSCFAGATMVRGDQDTHLKYLERDPSRWIFASGRNEVVLDGFKGEHSPFAKELFYLLETHRNEGLNVMRLIDRLTQNVKWQDHAQTPIGQPMTGVGHRGGQFVFWPKQTTTSPPGDLPTQTYPAQPSPNQNPKSLPTAPLPQATPPSVSPQSDLDPPPIKARVQRAIARARLKSIIPELEAWIFEHRPEFTTEIIIIQGDLASLNRDLIQGLLTYEEQNTRQARITSRLLSLVQSFP